MEVIELLEYLQDIIENSPKFIVGNKVVVSKDEVTDIIERIINFLPDEFKKAQWICEEKDRILNDAFKQAEMLKKEKVNIIKREIENHNITQKAQERAEDIITSAQKNANELRTASRDYAQDILQQLENEINKKSGEMLQNLQIELQQFMNSVSKEVNVNSKVLRKNIKELKNMK